MTVLDIEWGWHFDHEDLAKLRPSSLVGPPIGNHSYDKHGTAVIGELSADPDAWGVTGLTPDVGVLCATNYPSTGYSVAQAIVTGLPCLQTGDVMLVEAQASTPLGLGPTEWIQADFDAIVKATLAGVIVVEAAGNGNVDLASPCDRLLLDPATMFPVAAGSFATGNPQQLLAAVPNDAAVRGARFYWQALTFRGEDARLCLTSGSMSFVMPCGQNPKWRAAISPFRPTVTGAYHARLARNSRRTHMKTALALAAVLALAVPCASALSPPAPQEVQDVEKKLQALEAARQAGILSEAEYSKRKSELLAQREAGGAQQDAELQKKLAALEAARQAGILSEAEYARKKQELLAQHEASRVKESAELRKKLEALDAARAAGILSEAEYARKKQELMGGVVPASGAGGEAPPELARAARKGKTYRHVIGFTFWYPDGWQVQEQEDFLQLTPPQPGTSPEGPTEFYFVVGDTVEGQGITKPDDPRVIAYLDEQVKSISAALTRTGDIQAAAMANGKGAVLDWKGESPAGGEIRARCFVSIIKDHGVALLALGRPEPLATRDPELRAMFASFGFGDGQKDPVLVGTWDLVSTSTIDNRSPFEKPWNRASMVGENRSRLVLRPDGTWHRVDIWHMIAMGAGVSLEDKDRKESEGRWFAGDGTLFLVWKDNTWEDYRYRVGAGSGGRQLQLASTTRGQTWSEVK